MRGFDRKIFGHIFVHFAKIVKSPIGTAEPVQIAESRHLINFSQFTWINSFAREIPAPQFCIDFYNIILIIDLTGHPSFFRKRRVVR